MSDSSQLVIEVHVPLLPSPDLDPEDYQFPWIEEVDDFIAEGEHEGTVEMFDDGEENDGWYIFFLTGGSEDDLLIFATAIAALPGVPAGTFAMVTDSDADDFGLGRKVELIPE